MMDVLTIQADLDVLNHYHKQKSEFHFQQKSDNDFLMFLLDTAVRVISIVQHLAPVIEAVSAASNDPLDAASDSGEMKTVVNHLNMEVDSILEDQQLSLDIPSVPLPPPPVTTDQHISPEQLNTISELEKELKNVTETLSNAESYPSITQTMNPIISQAINPIINQAMNNNPISAINQAMNPTAPLVTPISDNYPEPTSEQSELPILETENIIIKPELPVPEVIDIKEEVMETPQYSDPSGLSQILSSDHINQLMSNVVGPDLMGNDTPSYVTAGKAANPLSMLHLQNNPSSMLGSSLASSSEQMSLMNALFPNQEGLDPGPSDVKDRKSGAGPSPSNSTHRISPNNKRGPFHCIHCLKSFSFKSSLDRHVSVIHLGQRRYSCPICGAAFGQKKQVNHHVNMRHQDIIARLHMIQT